MNLLPLFLDLAHRRVVLVGDERAAAKRDMLIRAGAEVHDVQLVSLRPEITRHLTLPREVAR